MDIACECDLAWRRSRVLEVGEANMHRRTGSWWVVSWMRRRAAGPACIAALVAAVAACSNSTPAGAACESGKWCQLSSTKAPSARSDFVEIWTGTRLLVWGGSNLGSAVADGAAWDASFNAW